MTFQLTIYGFSKRWQIKLLQHNPGKLQDVATTLLQNVRKHLHNIMATLFFLTAKSTLFVSIFIHLLRPR